MFTFCEFFHSGAPFGLDAAFARLGLGDVVDDDWEVGMTVDELQRDGDLALEEQEIVGEAVRWNLCEAAVEIFTEEVFVGFALEDVADAFELRMGGEAFEIRTDIFISERHPADDGFDEIRLIRK